jgi:hypothetical protein
MRQQLSPLDADYWKSHFPERLEEGWQRAKPLRADYIFLHTRITAPLPSGMTITAWHWFASFEDIIGYLRHAWLPDVFAEWLVRDDWDEDIAARLTLEELFERLLQQDPENNYADDIPLMQAQAEELDAVLKSPDPADRRAALSRFASGFNNEWAKSGTWEFAMKICCEPGELCAALVENEAFIDEPLEFNRLPSTRADLEAACERLKVAATDEVALALVQAWLTKDEF